MSNIKLLNFQNVNTDKYEYLEPFKSNNCYLSTCVYNIDGSNRLPYYYQSPRLYTPTGIYKLRNEFKLDLVIPLDSPFLEYLINEDDKNIQVTSENSQEWFDEHFTTEEVSDKYKTSLVFRQSGEDPILRVNIPSYRGKPTCEVFDVKSNPCDWSNVQPDTELVGILEKVGIKFYKEVLTGEYELHKIKVYMPAEHSKLPKGYIFQNDGSDAEEEEDNTEEQQEDFENGHNEDSDEDEESYLDNNEESDEELEGDSGDENDSDEELEENSDEELEGDSSNENDSDEELEGNSDEGDSSDENDSDEELEGDSGDEDAYSELSELDNLENELEEVTFTDEENSDDEEDASELEELNGLEDELEEVNLNNEENEDDGETSDSEEFDLSNVASLPSKSIQDLNDLDDELNDFNVELLNNDEDEGDIYQDENEESDAELGMESDVNEIEQDFEGGHEEELNETKGIQIEELTNDELDLNISDDETDIEEESNQQSLENNINELDELDLSDLEEADLHQEIQQDISRNMIEPEELSDDDLELDL